jgi:hypothetical protein
MSVRMSVIEGISGLVLLNLGLVGDAPKRKSPSFTERTRNSLALDVRRLSDGPSDPAVAVCDLVVRSRCRPAHRPRRARA